MISDNNVYDSLHDDVIDDDEFRDFLLRIEASGINLDLLVKNKKRIKMDEFHRFNMMLRKMHQDKVCDIIQSSVYLVRYYMDEKQVMSILDDENLYELKMTLGKKHKMGIKRPNPINEFFEENEE